MELYAQETEVALLGALRPHLSSGALVDVGAERGGFARALLAHGYGPAHLVEPTPESAAELREAFAERSDVSVLELAVGAEDGESTLYLAHDLDGDPMPAFNKLDTPGEGEIDWRAAHAVARRSLASLVDEGAIPTAVGLLKIDTEGADRDVVQGMGALTCEALMVEYWVDIPGTLGRSPWTFDSVRELLYPRGLTSVVSVRHHGLEIRVVDGYAELERHDYGNLIFLGEELHERCRAAFGLVARWADELSDARVALEEQRLALEAHARAVPERTLPATAKRMQRLTRRRVRGLLRGSRRSSR